MFLRLPRTARRAAAALLALAAGAASADVRISGSDTLEPLFQNALSQYSRGAAAEFKVSASFKGTGVGLRDGCEGRADVVPASVKIDNETLRRCQSNGIELIELPLAFDAVVMVANPARAGVGELNLEELKTIFHPDNATRITRWSQVRAGLPDVPLTVVSLDPRSGTNALVSQKLHGLRGFVRTDAKVSNDHAQILRLVAADPGAIGFVSMGALAESKAAVWKVPVNFGSGPVVASRESVLNDSYAPLSRLMYVYVSKASLNAKDSPTKEFVRWLMERGAKLAVYEGFVPLVDRNYQDNLRKLGTSTAP
jgi:phosphate transport system substrate-binding protein